MTLGMEILQCSSRCGNKHPEQFYCLIIMYRISLAAQHSSKATQQHDSAARVHSKCFNSSEPPRFSQSLCRLSSRVKCQDGGLIASHEQHWRHIPREYLKPRHVQTGWTCSLSRHWQCPESTNFHVMYKSWRISVKTTYGIERKIMIDWWDFRHHSILPVATVASFGLSSA